MNDQHLLVASAASYTIGSMVWVSPAIMDFYRKTKLALPASVIGFMSFLWLSYLAIYPVGVSQNDKAGITPSVPAVNLKHTVPQVDVANMLVSGLQVNQTIIEDRITRLEKIGEELKAEATRNSNGKEPKGFGWIATRRNDNNEIVPAYWRRKDEY